MADYDVEELMREMEGEAGEEQEEEEYEEEQDNAPSSSIPINTNFGKEPKGKSKAVEQERVLDPIMALKEVQDEKQRLDEEDAPKSKKGSSSTGKSSKPKQKTKKDIIRDIIDYEISYLEDKENPGNYFTSLKEGKIKTGNDEEFRRIISNRLNDGVNRDELEMYLDTILQDSSKIDPNLSRTNKESVLQHTIPVKSAKVEDQPPVQVQPKPKPKPKQQQSKVVQQEPEPEELEADVVDMIDNDVLTKADQMAINGLRQFHYLIAVGAENYARTYYRNLLKGFAAIRKQLTEDQYPAYEALWLEIRNDPIARAMFSPIGQLVIADVTAITDCIAQNSKDLKNEQ